MSNLERLAGGFFVLAVQNRANIFTSTSRALGVVIRRFEGPATALTPTEARELARVLAEAADLAEVEV